MNVDWGVVFGLTGVACGLGSIVYARTQSIHARRQADAANVATTLQLQREMSDRIFQHRMALVQDPIVAKVYYKALPALPEAGAEDGVVLASLVTMRNAIDGLQDMYFLRRRGVVERYHWRHWTSVFNTVSQAPTMRLVYDHGVEHNVWEPEFVEFLRPVFDGQPLADPKVE
ncbi:MAG TPA: hypothetical protein VKB39_10505 [Candidatus Baltobacteraceae bacterium]|nr:hypothetical protein [Candidatus Baltobacteraceae bacterium]